MSLRPVVLRLWRVSWVLMSLLALGGCEACLDPERRPDGCTLDDGSTLPVGARSPVGDGCNVCLCTSALALRCTSGPCGDAGPAGDGGPDEVDAGGGEPSDAGAVDAGVVDAGAVDAGPAEDPCADSDGDGFHPCADPNFPDRPLELDCDDTRFHVQPGGYEFPDTSEDDNCNGSADEWTPCACAVNGGTATDVASAFDLCGATLRNATRSGQPAQFGVVGAYQGSIDPNLRAVEAVPGEPPRLVTNGCMATLATGDAVGRGGTAGGGCSPSGAHHESMACGMLSCTGGEDFGDTTICDLARMDLSLQVPPNAKGFAFDFMFLSYEWPEFLCNIYNDTFLALVRTAAVDGGAETNAAFDPEGRPITVNVGFFEEPDSWTVPLDDTSFGLATDGATCPSGSDVLGCTLPAYCAPDFDGRNGSGSGWLTTSVPVRPGEENVRLTLRIHDEGDADFDSIVLLDNFRWLPFEPPLRTGKGSF